MRTLVRDIIAELVGHLVSWALQVLATLGVGMTWVVPQVVAEVAKVAARIADITSKLVRAFKALAPLLKKLGKGFGDAGDKLRKIKADGSSAGPGKTPPPPKAGSGDAPATTRSTGADPGPPTGGRGGPTPTPDSSRGDSSLFGAPVRPPSASRTRRTGDRTVGARSGPMDNRPPRAPQSAPQGSGSQSASPPAPQGTPPPKVISSSSFADDAARNKYMQEHGLGDLQKINKDNFDNKVPKHDTNCGHCTISVARWFKTGQVHPAPPSDTMSLQQPAVNARQHGMDGRFEPVADYDEINRKMAAQPPGSVASVAAKWPDQQDGHFFNVAKMKDGSVAYLDGQTGMPADISKKPSELYATDFKDVPTGSSPGSGPSGPGQGPQWQYRESKPEIDPDTPPSSPASSSPPSSPVSPGGGNGPGGGPSSPVDAPGSGPSGPGQGPQWEYRESKPEIDPDTPPSSPASSSPPPSPLSPGSGGDVSMTDAAPNPPSSSGNGDVSMTDAAPSPPSSPTDRDGDVSMGGF